MDFSYSEVQQMLQDSVKKFVSKNYDFDTRSKIIGSDSGYSEENWKLFAELGWLTVPFSEEDGGLGGSAVDLMVMMEEFGKANLVEPYLPSVVLCGCLISELAIGEVREQMLGKLVGGDLQLALAASETGSRFNSSKVATTAKSNGNNIIINGRKIAVLKGSTANELLVVARESGGEVDADGISVFLVNPDTSGVTVRPFTNIDGQKSSEIDFDDVTVSASARLGEQGNALMAIEKVIDKAIIAVSAEAVGVLETLLQKTVEYSKTRKQFGTVIGTFQALQHRMADMFIECQLARSIVVMAAMKLDGSAGQMEKTKAVSAAKSRVGKAIRKVSQEAVQIHGGIGVTNELDVGHYFKRATALEIMFGNTDYHIERFASL